MQYILTKTELDELKNKPRVTAQEFLEKLSEYITVKTVCIDVNVGPESTISLETFRTAVKKTKEYYAKQNP